MKDKILKLVSDRTKLIDKLNQRFEGKVTAAQAKLLEAILQDFVDKLDTKDGKIANTLRNQRLVGMLDTTFEQFVNIHGPAVLSSIVEGVSQIINFNEKYFSVFTEPAKLLPVNAQVKTSISSWLGVEDAKVARNGYLDKLVQADAVRQAVKDLAMGKVAGQAGLTETRAALKDMFTEDAASGQNQLGGLQRYYRNFTYDLFSQVDRTAAKISADKVGANQFAIYEGGLIKTSRKFCRERNGKVFTAEEIADFDPPEAKQPDYNPFTDLGGFSCRHHLNYIPYAVAVSLRPDLKMAD